MSEQITRSEAVKISRSLLKKGDLTELAKFNYAISPTMFKKLSALQGVKIRHVGDVVVLASNVANGDKTFNFKRLFNQLKHKSERIANAKIDFEE